MDRALRNRLYQWVAHLIAAGISQFKGGISGAGVAAFLITAVVIGALLFRRYAYGDGAFATIATGEQGFSPTYLAPGALCLGVGLGFIAGLVYAPVGLALIAASIAGIRLSRYVANLPGRLVARFLCVGLASGALSQLLLMV